MNHLRHSLIALAMLLLAVSGHAAPMTLDSQHSVVSFVSVKNKDIAEVHSFASLSGSISDEGAVLVSIDSASLSTGIPIRDERMKEHLFAVADFPAIEIQAQVDMQSIQPGNQRMQLSATVSLVGKELPIELDVLVNASESGLMVSSVKPVVVYAAQVGLIEAIAKLAELAGGISIGNSTSVSFVLSFNP